MKLHFIAIGVLLATFSMIEPVLADEALKLADRLLERGHYNEAITEYKRFIFFNPEDEQFSYALYRMGLAHRAGREWQEAIDALKASVRVTQNAKVADERRITLATTLIASGNYNLARLELLRVSEFGIAPSPRLRATYFGGIASLYMFDWDATEKAFGGFYSEYAGGRTAGRAGEINSVLHNARGSYKSAGLARFLSTILPGSGQMYAGDWRDALNSLALNSVTIGLLANAVYRKDYMDAALISSISMRYYMGNRYRAEVDVRKHNESMDRQNAMKILNIVREDEP
ncbi:tol-pal system YbgF family protein [Candidatus Poribacteria bacterium]